MVRQSLMQTFPAACKEAPSPPVAALYRALALPKVWMLTLQLAAMSRRITSAWPLLAALCSAVEPLEVFKLTCGQQWVSDTSSADCMTCCPLNLCFVCHIQAVLIEWLNACKARVPFAFPGLATHDIARGSWC